MSSRSEAQLRRWIQEVAATSEPIDLDDVLDWPPVDSDPSNSTDVTITISESLELAEPAWERPMSSKRAAIILAVAAAVIAVVAFAVTSGDGSNGNDVAAEGDEPTAAPADEQTTVLAPASSPAQIATEFWQALETGDREAVLDLVDPTALGPDGPVPFGRGDTFEATFDWYEAVDWQWQLDECSDRDDGAARCSATASNAWSEALGVEPVTGIFIVRFGENGIIELEDQVRNFLAQWSPQVFEVFARWVDENHPDDAAIMFGDVDVNPEILSLYEVNTARFVEAQQTE